MVTLRRDWRDLATTAELRRNAAGLLLTHLLAQLPTGQRGTDLLVETTLGKLRQALAEDLHLKSAGWDLGKLLDRALLWPARAGGHPAQPRTHGVPSGHGHSS